MTQNLMVFTLCAFLLTACHSAPKTVVPPATVTVAGVTWQNAGSSPIGRAESAPDSVSQLGYLNWTPFQFRSSSAQEIRVQAFEMRSPASAFEAIQRWQSRSGTSAFHKGVFVVVSENATLPQKELLAFSAALFDAWKLE